MNIPVTGLDPATHVFFLCQWRGYETWMTGTSPVMGSL
jgi:hypothetical protein